MGESIIGCCVVVSVLQPQEACKTRVILGTADGCKGPTLATGPRKARAERRSRLEVEINGLGNGCGVQRERKEAEGIRSIWL